VVVEEIVLMELVELVQEMVVSLAATAQRTAEVAVVAATQIRVIV
jgi:hypothetical protein